MDFDRVKRVLCTAAFGVLLSSPAGARQLIVVSFDGFSNEMLSRCLTDGTLPPDGAFARAAREGLRAAAMRPLNVSVTVPAHIAMYTGAYPDTTGIVAATFIRANDPIDRVTEAFGAPIATETIWEAAKRQGKTIGCVRVMGADANGPSRSCTWTWNRGAEDEPGALFDLQPSEERIEWTGLEAEHSLPMKSTSGPMQFVAGNVRTPLHAIGLDTIDDGMENYDTLLVSPTTNAEDPRAVKLRTETDEWKPLLVERSPRLVGALVRVLGFRLYVSPHTVPVGAPAEWLREVEQRLGVWPGTADAYGRVGEGISWEQERRLADYYLSVSLEMLKKHPDILMTYMPATDDYGHDFTLDDPRQRAYEAEGGARRVRFHQNLRRAYQLADAFLLRLMHAAPDANFMIVSDHGMQAEHSVVSLARLIASVGIDMKDIAAIPNGPSAHIYLNTRTRPNGRLTTEAARQIADKLAAACLALRDPETGETVFDAVEVGREIERYKVWHAENAGDVWVNARAGYLVSSEQRSAVVTRMTSTFGGHGHLGTVRSMQAIFLAWGPNVPHAQINTIDSVQVAPTIAALAGIEKPRNAAAPPAFVPGR